MMFFGIIFMIAILSGCVGIFTSPYDMEGEQYNRKTRRLYKMVADRNKVSVRTVRFFSTVNRICHAISLIMFGIAFIAALSTLFSKEEVVLISITAPRKVELIERKNDETSFYVSRHKDALEMFYENSGKIVDDNVPIEDCSFVKDEKNYVIIRERAMKVKRKSLFFITSTVETRNEKLYEIHTNTGVYDQLAGL